MKKFFAILALASFLAACNNASDSKTTTDSTTTVDSNRMETHKTDTTTVKDSLKK